MLTLTDSAAEVVRELTAGSGLEPDPGLRIAPGAPTPDGTPLELALAPGPEPSDQTVEEAGATVYVEDNVVEALDDKVLDAAVDGTQVRFSIREQPQAGDDAGDVV